LVNLLFSAFPVRIMNWIMLHCILLNNRHVLFLYGYERLSFYKISFNFLPLKNWITKYYECNYRLCIKSNHENWSWVVLHSKIFFATFLDLNNGNLNFKTALYMFEKCCYSTLLRKHHLLFSKDPKFCKNKSIFCLFNIYVDVRLSLV